MISTGGILKTKEQYEVEACLRFPCSKKILISVMDVYFFNSVADAVPECKLRSEIGLTF